MSKIVVATDSSACMPDSAVEGLDIAVMPLWLLWDRERFRDGIDIETSAFYDRLARSHSMPSTSQPSPDEFAAFYRSICAPGDAVVSVLVSSQISGTIASALVAQSQTTDRTIRVVDSLNCSMGLGLAVLAAARAAAAGASLDEVVHAAETVRDRAQLLFMVDTLEYLHRGGRISGAKRALGTVLRIKPILHFFEGRIESFAQARTKGKALAQLLEIAEERLGGKAMGEAAVVDINAAEDGDAFAADVRQRFTPPVVHRTGVSPVVGTHVGPGGIGIAFCPAD